MKQINKTLNNLTSEVTRFLKKLFSFQINSIEGHFSSTTKILLNATKGLHCWHYTTFKLQEQKHSKEVSYFDQEFVFLKDLNQVYIGKAIRTEE
jgi:hypothetical protein